MKVANLDIRFHDFSESKLFRVRPDIVDVPKEMNKPVYNLIIGVKTMTKMGIVLDFKTKMLVIDDSIQPMKPLKSLKDTISLNNLRRDHLESNSTQDFTK